MSFELELTESMIESINNCLHISYDPYNPPMWIEYGIKLNLSLLTQLLINLETGKLYDDVGPVSNLYDQGMNAFEQLKTNPSETMSNTGKWIDTWPIDYWLSVNGFKLAMMFGCCFISAESHSIESIIKLHNFMEELKRTNRIPQDSRICSIVEE
jgi:hypothetical protein